MKKTSVRILLVALLISTIFAVPVFADGPVVPGLEMPKIVVSPTTDNATYYGRKIEAIGSVIADGNMAILLCIVAVAAGAVTVLLLKKRKVKKDD